MIAEPFPARLFARLALAAVSLLAIVCVPLTTDAAPPCGLCLGTPSLVFGPPNLKYKQQTLAPNNAPDRLRLQGRLPPGTYGAWSGAVDGGSVCFSDSNPAGPFLGANLPMPASGWVSYGTLHKFYDPGPPSIKAIVKQTPSFIKFKVAVNTLGNVLGSITPVIDEPTTAMLYFGAGGAFGCGSYTRFTCVSNIPLTTLNCN